LHLTVPWRVVLAGAPNVGKSSLVNAIAGYQRAIVSPIPGTTRDIVTVTTAIDGWPVLLADTAGLRRTHDELEPAGVELADTAIADADLVVLVVDASANIDTVNEIAPRLLAAQRVIVVWNKIDRVPDTERARLRIADCGLRIGHGTPQEIGNPLFVSAVTGDGIAEFITAIGGALVPIAPPAGAAVVFTRCQVSSLESARAAIARRDAVAAGDAVQSLLANPE
jgi:tRNA modification GTPase